MLAACDPGLIGACGALESSEHTGTRGVRCTSHAVLARPPQAAGAAGGRHAAAAKAVATLEARLRALVSMLSGALSDTRGRIEKKQAQTYDEMVAEQAEAEQVR